MKIGPGYNESVYKTQDKILKFITGFTVVVATGFLVACVYFYKVGDTNRAVTLFFESVFIILLSFGVYKFSK